jgi:hypothetical protein
MPELTHPLPSAQAEQAPGRVPPWRRTVRAVRPPLTDLPCQGDTWVIDNRDGTASLYLGGRRLLCVRLCPFDLAGLNRALGHLRLGQARRGVEAQRGSAPGAGRG